MVERLTRLIQWDARRSSALEGGTNTRACVSLLEWAALLEESSVAPWGSTSSKDTWQHAPEYPAPTVTSVCMHVCVWARERVEYNVHIHVYVHVQVVFGMHTVLNMSWSCPVWVMILWFLIENPSSLTLASYTIHTHSHYLSLLPTQCHACACTYTCRLLFHWYKNRNCWTQEGVFLQGWNPAPCHCHERGNFILLLPSVLSPAYIKHIGYACHFDMISEWEIKKLNTLSKPLPSNHGIEF